MALELKSDFSQKADGTEVYFEVEDATGLYDAVDNPGGFGDPNPDRNEVALIFYGNHKRVAGDVEVVVNSYDPLTVDTFTISMAKLQNGHLEAYIFAVLIFDSGGVYDDGDITYNNESPATPFLQKRVAGQWVEITAADLVGEEDEVTTLLENEFPVPQAKEFIDELNADQLKKLRPYIKGECGKDDFELLRDRHDYAKGLLVTATDDFAAQAYNEAQAKIEEIFDYQEILEEAD